jgi:hypothetical protein
MRTTLFSIAAVVAIASSSVSGFVPLSSTTPTTTTNRIASTFTTTKLYQAPENFADVAKTIAEAAGELSGKTIVVKYGGVSFF